jgi:hypothetical protein
VNVLVTTNKHLEDINELYYGQDMITILPIKTRIHSRYLLHLLDMNEFERCISPIELKCIKKINYTYQIPMYLCRIGILTIKMYFDCQQQFCLFNELVKP